MKTKAPWLKGCVERVIRTMSEKLLHPTKGTTFHNTLKLMDYNPLKDAVCTIDDLDHALHKYFIDIYPREPRRSLNNARSIDLWRNLTKEYPVTTIDDVASLDQFFGRTDTAAVRRTGVSAHCMQYSSPELHQHFKTPKFRNAMKKAGGTVTYYLDPGDISRIYVRLPHRPQTIMVPVAPKWRKYAAGLSLFHHKQIRRYLKSRANAANGADGLLECKAELLEIMRGQAFGKRSAVRAAQTLARIEGIARYARYGDDVRTTAPGSEAHQRSQSPPRPPAASNDVDCEATENAFSKRTDGNSGHHNASIRCDAPSCTTTSSVRNSTKRSTTEMEYLQELPTASAGRRRGYVRPRQ